MASLFPDGTLKNATCTSPRNSVDFNQSEDDFKTIEVFPVKCAVCIICSANGSLRLRLGHCSFEIINQ